MKRCTTLPVLLLLLLLLSCGEKNMNLYTIDGKTGEAGEKVFLFGLDSRYERLDSTTSDSEGEFTFTINADTVTPLALLMPEGNIVTLYAEPGTTAKLNKDTTLNSGYSVEGGATQALHDSISRLLDGCASNSQRMAIIDEFIAKYPVSEINVEIMRRYMVDTPSPDNGHIRNRISKLGGILQDHEFFATTKKNIDKKNSNTLHRLFPSFTYTTAEGEEVNLEEYKNKYTLITFWAPWDEACMEKMKKLKAVADTIESNSYAILNIALDHNKARWEEAMANDTIEGDNVCDTKAWNSELVNNFNIKSLPYSILLSPYLRIIMFDADIDRMGTYIDSLAVKFDKEQKEKEKRNRKKNKSKRW